MKKRLTAGLVAAVAAAGLLATTVTAPAGAAPRQEGDPGTITDIVAASGSGLLACGTTGAPSRARARSSRPCSRSSCETDASCRWLMERWTSAVAPFDCSAALRAQDRTPTRRSGHPRDDAAKRRDHPHPRRGIPQPDDRPDKHLPKLAERRLTEGAHHDRRVRRQCHDLEEQILFRTEIVVHQGRVDACSGSD